MGMIPDVNEILMNRKDIWNAITIVYPVCRQGLEIECGEGYNLSIGRKRSQNLWGISSVNHSAKWAEHGVSPFCRQMKPTEITYNDDSFDVVIQSNDLIVNNEEDARKTLENIKRVCSLRAYLNLPIKDSLTKSWWLKTILDTGFIIECFHVTTANTIVAELQC